MNKTVVNVIREDGTISRYCEFINDFPPEYNLLTLCMSEHMNNNVTDADQRKKFENKLIKAGKHVFFKHENNTYITKIINL